MTSRRALHLFVIRSLVLILLLALIWPFLAPSYSRVVAACASELLGQAVTVWPDARGHLQADKEWRGRWGALRRESSPQGVRGSWEGLLFLTALVLATPRMPRRRRVLVLISGWFLLTLFYALYTYAYFEQIFSPATRLYFWFPLSEIWVPLVLWGALAFPQIVAAFPGGTSESASPAGRERKIGGLYGRTKTSLLRLRKMRCSTPRKLASR